MTSATNTSRAAFKIIFIVAALFFVDSAQGQNIVVQLSDRFITANPVRLTDTDVSELFFRTPEFTARDEAAEPRRVLAKLQTHVAQFLEGAPWMPFHHTLGISGYEVYFDHPDELFLALAPAVPCLREPLAGRLREFLRRQLAQHPPYAEPGYERQHGRPRESYDVPAALRFSGRGQAADALGVYAFWAYCQYATDPSAAALRWEAIKTRTKSLLAGEYQFDLQKKSSGKGEAHKLNGDLAGLIGLARLARWQQDAVIEQAALRRGRELLEWRVNLERTHPFLLEPSDAATKPLHNARLSRYCRLVPEVGEALARSSGDCGPRNLRTFREERHGWFMAFGERFIGGENYTNPLHFPRSLFAGAALIEQLPAPQLLTFIDVPWCKGDMSFIERCVLALWADAGRPWKKP
jgi:hypothetical protein